MQDSKFTAVASPSNFFISLSEVRHVASMFALGEPSATAAITVATASREINGIAIINLYGADWRCRACFSFSRKGDRSIITSVDPRISVPNGALIIIAGIVRVAVISHGSQADAGHERPTRAPPPSGPPSSISTAGTDQPAAVKSAAITAPEVSTAIEPAA